MGCWGVEAFEDDTALMFCDEIYDRLEAELVGFRHRVRFRYGMDCARARAAMVLLSRLVDGGLKWTAPDDCTPLQVRDAFENYANAMPADWVAAMRRDVSEFLVATRNSGAAIVLIDEHGEPYQPRLSVAEAMRHAGAEPRIWLLLKDLAPEEAWLRCSMGGPSLVQLAISVSVPPDEILRALGVVLQRALPLLDTAKVTLRNRLGDALTQLCREGVAALRQHREMISSAVEEIISLRRRAYQEGVTEDALNPLIMVLGDLTSIPGVEALSDPVRMGDLAQRAERTIGPVGIRLGSELAASLHESFGRHEGERPRRR